jgi:hypothetical protein
MSLQTGTMPLQTGTIVFQVETIAFQATTIALQTETIPLQTALIHFQTKTMRVETTTIKNSRTLAAPAMRSAFATPALVPSGGGLGDAAVPQIWGVWGNPPKGSDFHRTCLGRVIN